MTSRDMTLIDAERLARATGDADVVMAMDEDTFRAFYDRTARVLWGYLARISRDPHVADDLVQETYYRFLRAGTAYEDEAHRRHSLFRIATNLVRDAERRRRSRPEFVVHDDEQTAAPGDAGPAAADRRADLSRAMTKLKPRERALVWLAYAQGASHREIGDVLGVRTGSVKILLFRARRKLAAFLRGRPDALGGSDARGGRHDH